MIRVLNIRACVKERGGSAVSVVLEDMSVLVHEEWLILWPQGHSSLDLWGQSVGAAFGCLDLL